MGRISEETEERHVPCFFYFLLVVALCGLLVQPAQAEPVDSVRVEGEHQVAKQKKKEDEAGIRLVKKLMAGGLGGVGGAFLGGALMAGGQHQTIEGGSGVGNFVSLMGGIWVGNIVGTAVGVSVADPQDNFLITLLGSALFGAVPVAIALEGASGNLIILSGLLGPIVGAMITSELSHKPPQARRVSVGLVPNLKGGLSAVSVLRF